MAINRVTDFDEINQRQGLVNNQSSKGTRDPLRYVNNRLRAVESIFNVSDTRHEIIVCPLAIYREMHISGM
jgi:hypothetical protein